jgi:hypothetical protein
MQRWQFALDIAQVIDDRWECSHCKTLQFKQMITAAISAIQNAISVNSAAARILPSVR